jgi:cytochrome c553
MPFRSTIATLTLTSRTTSWMIQLMATAAVAAVSCVVPATAHADGSPQRGRVLVYTCYGCHGIANYKNVYPTYSVPKLQGQSPDYLTSALQAYRSGERAHATMHAQAASLSDQDMQDIASFVSGKPLKSEPGGPKADVAAAAPKSAALCMACHGPDGIGIAPLYPTLAGQHADYLEQALHDYKNGARKNPVMASFAAQLSDKDISEIAAYYAKQRPSLATAEHAIIFTQLKKYN